MVKNIIISRISFVFVKIFSQKHFVYNKIRKVSFYKKKSCMRDSKVGFFYLSCIYNHIVIALVEYNAISGDNVFKI